MTAAAAVAVESLTEWGRADDVDLSPAQVAGLLASKAFQVEPSGRSGRWTIRANRHVGVAQFDGLELRVTPKVPVRRLLSLMLWSQKRIAWDEDIEPEYSADNDIVTLLAAAFTNAAERLARRGLLQGYRSMEEALPTIRGRIMAGAQLSRRAGLPLPVELQYDEYTFDIIENQMLAGAVAALGTAEHLPIGLHSRLRRLRRDLDGIEPWRRGQRLPMIEFTRLNGRYRPALALAELVLSGRTLHESGPDGSEGRHGPGFLIDMDKVFEDAIGGGLEQLMGRRTIALQHIAPLDDAESMQIKPDIVVFGGAEVATIADIKYRDARKRDIRGDVYQVLAYAQRYNLTTVHLIYAARPERPVLRIGGTVVHLHHIDLDTSADAFDAQLSALAQRLHR